MTRSKSILWGGVVLVMASVAARASTISLTPVSASGTHTVAGNQIQITGTPQRVFLEIRISNFAPNNINVWQATIDSSTYSSGASGTLTPAFLACASNAICASTYGTGSNCVSKCAGGANNGAICTLPADCPGGACNPTDCAAGFQDITRPNWIFAGAAAINAVSLATLDYAYGAVTLGLNATDPGTFRYGGTLVLNVPNGAVGTFTVQFVPSSGLTFIMDGAGAEHSLTLNSAQIVVKCTANSQCNDSNACTTDTCNTGTGMCVNQPNYNPLTQCCNPANGATVALSDGNTCTQDVCNVQTGAVTHPGEPIGTACGSSSNTECDRADTCNGSGSCLNNIQPAGTACGSPTNTQCNLADTCDGAGACSTNIRPAGFACGSPGSGPCDNPDSCNGLGTCLTNQVANNTPCDDSLFCTLSTICTAGVCGGGTPRNCADSLTCTTDSCDEVNDECDSVLDAGRCLIASECFVDGQLNPVNTCEECDPSATTTDWTVLSDGTLCNDGNACTGTGRPGIGFDTCTGGSCAGVLDPQCNDQCEFAVEVVGGTASSNNSSAGPDDAEASCEPNSNGDVWFEYTAVCDGKVFASTTGSLLTPDNDPVLNVFDDCPLDGGVEVACDDDSGLGLNGALTFNALGGVTYFFRVAGYGANTGDIVINVLPFDDCVIDGVCYDEDDLNPENPCQACVPDLSTTTWSNVPEGTACGSAADTDCDSPDACDGLGVCEVNHKPDDIPCTDDGNVCSMDFCQSGLCTHPPEPAGLTCGDPTNTDCDNPDTCDGGGSCVDNFEGAGFACGDSNNDQCDNPDTCNGSGSCLDNFETAGTPCNDGDVCSGSDACDGGGACEGVSVSLTPTVTPFGALALKVTPQPPGSPGPVAIHMTSSTWPCLDLYVQADGTLGVNPVFQLPSAWGTVTVYDAEIVPSSFYSFEAECGTFTSPAGTASTRKWGDLNQDTFVDFVDITLMVTVFKGLMPGFALEIFDIYPCGGDGLVDFRDISREVDAFQSDPFPCAIPCP